MVFHRKQGQQVTMVVVRKRERKGVDLETSERDDVTSSEVFFGFSFPFRLHRTCHLTASTLKVPRILLPRAGRTTRLREPERDSRPGTGMWSCSTFAWRSHVHRVSLTSLRIPLRS